MNKQFWVVKEVVGGGELYNMDLDVVSSEDEVVWSLQAPYGTSGDWEGTQWLISRKPFVAVWERRVGGALTHHEIKRAKLVSVTQLPHFVLYRLFRKGWLDKDEYVNAVFKKEEARA